MIKLKWHPESTSDLVDSLPECLHAVSFPSSHHKEAATTLSAFHRQKHKQVLTHLCPFQTSLTPAFHCESYCSDYMSLKSMAAGKGGKKTKCLHSPWTHKDVCQNLTLLSGPLVWRTEQ